MKLIKKNIGKTYFDPSIKGDIVAITFQNMNWGVLTGNSEIQSCGGSPEYMYEVDGVGFVWLSSLIWITN